MFSLEHLLVLLFFLIGGILLIRWAKKQPTKTQDKVGIILANTIGITVIVWTLIKIWLGKLSIENDLPLHMCNFVGLVAMVLARTKNKLIFEIIFFWILSGTLQALFTPELANSFPNYNFFKFWIVHAGMVVYMMYMVFVQHIRPTFMSVFKSVAGLLVFALFLYIINLIIGANYMYLLSKPPNGSLLDVFGKWPYYIFQAALVLIPFFSLIYLPFFIVDSIRKK